MVPWAVEIMPLIWLSVALGSVHTAVPAVFGPRLALVPAPPAPAVGVGSTANAALAPPMTATVVTTTTAAPTSRDDALENLEG
jgi:hypothetical protein